MFGEEPIVLIRPSWSTWVDIRKAIMDQIGVFVPQIRTLGVVTTLDDEALKVWLTTLVGSYTELQTLVLRSSWPEGGPSIGDLDPADVLNAVNVTLEAILIPLIDSEKNSLAPLFGAAEKWKTEIAPAPAKATGGNQKGTGQAGTSSSKR